MQGKTAKIGCGLFGVSKNFYNLNTLTYWQLRYRFSCRSLRKEGGGGSEPPESLLTNPCKRCLQGFLCLAVKNKKSKIENEKFRKNKNSIRPGLKPQTGCFPT